MSDINEELPSIPRHGALDIISRCIENFSNDELAELVNDLTGSEFQEIRVEGTKAGTNPDNQIEVAE